MWGFIFYLAYQNGLVGGDLDTIGDKIKEYNSYALLIFFLLFTFRLFFFVPATIFMVTGGLLFSPIQAVPVGMLAIITTETAVFIAGRYSKNSKLYHNLLDKYPTIFKYLEKCTPSYLIVTLLCPIVPLDVTCFAVATTNMKYYQFILAVITANLPIHILYSLFGSTILSSPILGLGIGFTIFLVSILIIIIWKKSTAKMEQRDYQ